MKRLFTIILVLNTLLVFSSEKTQEDLLDGSHKQFFANKNLQNGTYILTRDLSTPEITEVLIIKETNTIKTTSVGSGFRINGLTRDQNLYYESGYQVTSLVREQKVLILDFSHSKILSENETEVIEFKINFYDDEIEVVDVSINNSQTEIELPGFFDSWGEDEDTYSFSYEE